VIFENSFAIKPGKYKLQVRITDDNQKSRGGTYTEDIEVPDFENSQLNLSQIELSTQVLKGGNNDDMFVKNGYTIFPNPSRFYGSNLPRLTLYAELYNLEYEAGSADNTYGVDFILTDEAGSVIKEFPSKTFNKAGQTAIIIHSLNVISIQSGRYYLLIRVTDHVSKKTALAKKLFVIYREGESIYETQADDSFFKDMDAQGAVRAGNIISIIGKSEDTKIYAQLELDGKKKFLDRFWKERDPSPGTKTNELLMDYYKRYEDANQKFSTPNREGWKTDMGRVYMVYGPPGQIEKHEFESDKYPYQIWYYYQLKDQPAQTLFVFGDVSDSGIQQLLHSNARGEMADARWGDRIVK
jgi:GWxTD domain-containing protein